MKKFIIPLITVVTVVVIVLSGCVGAPPPVTPPPVTPPPVTPPPEEELPEVTVTIGVLQPLTGPVGDIGLGGAQGCRLAAKQINEAGGFIIGGERCFLDLIEFDDKMDPSLSVTGASMMVDAGVPIIMGPIAGAPTMAAQKVTEPAHVSIMGYNVTEEIIDRPGINYTFGGDTPANRVLYYGPYYVGELGLRSVVLLVFNDPQFRETAELVTEDFEARGCEVLATEIFEADTTDFYTYLTKLEGFGADALFVMGTGVHGALICKQRLELGWPVQILSTDTFYGTGMPFFQAAGPSAEGVIEAAFGLDPFQELTPTVVESLGYDPVKREAFIHDVIEEYGLEFLSLYQGIYFDYVYAAVEAMVNAQSYDDKDAIHYALERTDYRGTYGHYTWWPDLHRTSYTRMFVRLHITDPETMEYFGEPIGLAEPVREPAGARYQNWITKVITPLSIPAIREALGY